VWEGTPCPMDRVWEGTPCPMSSVEFGMWDFEGYRRQGHRVLARGLDDVAGCAAILSALGRLACERHPPPVLGCFTRAEEVGFVGATDLARRGGLPRGALVVSVETSRWRPGAVLGRGPVVRLGDRASLFDPEATWALSDVAESQAKRRRHFRWQRALLDGGTCEATPFRLYGYRVAALACPLDHYHNHGPRGPAPEAIDIRDWRGLVDLIVAASRELPEAIRKRHSIRDRVDGLYREYWRRL
jgi:putative aminopeptidase FrvX